MQHRMTGFSPKEIVKTINTLESRIEKLSQEEIQDIWQIDSSFTPLKSRELINQHIKGWYRAVDALEYWTKN